MAGGRSSTPIGGLTSVGGVLSSGLVLVSDHGGRSCSQGVTCYRDIAAGGGSRSCSGGCGFEHVTSCQVVTGEVVVQ